LCPKHNQYEKIAFLGEGQFATVYKAKNAVTGDIVAVKKIKVGTRADAEDGINRTALREIKILRELDHKNIVRLIDIFGESSNISLVLDFMDTDLEVIIKDNMTVFSPGHVKHYLIQTLEGLEYLHDRWILHRDMKPNNLLVDEAGLLKISDFGLAKQFGDPRRINTPMVVTRWYRAPELLFGARHYSVGVDMWAVGCILAELLLRVPFLPGESDLDQLNRIFKVLGTPTDDVWPHVATLSDFVKFERYDAIPLHDIFTAAGEDLLAVIATLLSLHPGKRLTCSEVLQMDYFRNHPAPMPLLWSKQRQEEAKNREKMNRRMFDGAEIYGAGLVKRLEF
jgi:cyclin-dependent kinase 7